MESHTREPGRAPHPLDPLLPCAGEGEFRLGDTPRPPAKGLAPLCAPPGRPLGLAKRPDLSPATQTRFSHTLSDLSPTILKSEPDLNLPLPSQVFPSLLLDPLTFRVHVVNQDVLA